MSEATVPATKKFALTRKSVAAILLGLLAAGAGTYKLAGSSAPAPVKPDVAATSEVGSEVTVRFTAKSGKDFGKIVVLNDTERYQDRKLTLVLPKSVFPSASPEQYIGKTYDVQGTISLYNNSKQIKIDEPSQMKLVTKK